MMRLARLLVPLFFVVSLFAQDVLPQGGRAGRTSEFQPEKEDDTRFVVDEGEGLDTSCTFRGDGPLVIHLPIRRYVGEVETDGRLKAPGALVAAGVLSRTAKLRLPVYDVDTAGNPDDPSVPPEVDVISVNGQPVGELSGVTDEWKLNEFSVDVRHLRFPAMGGPPAENVIEIRIDTANEAGGEEAWCTAVDWVELTFDAVAPVFLVHGVLAQGDTWKSVQLHLDAQRIPNGTVDLSRVASIEWNARLLERALYSLAEDFGARRCHIVAHSKGGLETRAYLHSRYDAERLKVLSVHTLSTPHRGSPVADLGMILGAAVTRNSQLFKLLRLLAPGLEDLTTWNVAAFNTRTYAIPRGTSFYSYAADADLNDNFVIGPAEATGLPLGEYAASVWGTLTYNVIGQGERVILDVAEPTQWGERVLNDAAIVELSNFVKNDTLVSEISAQYGHYLGIVEANHATVKEVTAPKVVTRIMSRPSVAVRSVAQAPHPPALTTSSIVRDSFRLTPSSRTHTYTVPVDATPSVRFLMLAASRTLTISITAPGGAIYTPELVPLEGDGAVGAAYVLDRNNPLPGNWSVTVTEPGPVVSLSVVSSVHLANQVQSALVGGGQEAFPLAGKVRLGLMVFDGTRRLTALTIAAVLLDPDDSGFEPVPVIFRDDGTDADQRAGDGIYQAFVTPPAPGEWAVRVDALGTASTGSFRRSAATQVLVVRREAEITGAKDFGVDDDSDGLDDRIILRPYAVVERAGKYEVFVRLRASNGRDIQRTVEATFTAGPAFADVPFPAGALIDDLGVDGPYTVVEVRFSRVAGEDVVPADVRYYLGPTHAYDLDDLQHARIRLEGDATARGIDVGDGGRFDFLEVQLGVAADIEGTYSWSATLRDLEGKEISFVTGEWELVRGTTVLHLRFPGEDISRRRRDGPYVVTNLAIYGEGQSLVANDVLTTPAFRASQFGDPPRRRRVRR